MIRKLAYKCAIAAVIGTMGISGLNPIASMAQTETRESIIVAEKVSEVSMGEEDHEHHEDMTKEMQEMMAKMQDKLNKMQEHFGQMTPEEMEENHEQMMTNMQEIMAKIEEMEGMMFLHQH